MSESFGSQNMVGRLRTAIVRAPGLEFEVDHPQDWGYHSRPDADRARTEHGDFAAAVEAAGCELWWHDDDLPGLADAIFTHDPALVTDHGAVILRMGKSLRRGEESAIAGVFEQRGIPVLFELAAPATAEGGDLLWVDQRTLIAGRGFRTNAAGVEQLRSGLKPLGIEVRDVALPYGAGPDACLHLMSLVSLVDRDLAVGYLPLMPVPLIEWFDEWGIHVVEVPEDEWPTMGPNVLALGPRDCLMLEGNPITRARLEDAGCRVQTYVGNEISLKAEGGATCLVRPVRREPIAPIHLEAVDGTPPAD